MWVGPIQSVQALKRKKKIKYPSRLTDACSIRIIKKNPKGRNGVKREKSVEVRKQRGFCCNRGEIGNTWKPK